MVYKICCSDRRILIVCNIAPIIGIAKKHSKYLVVSQSITPIVSPFFTPICVSELLRILTLLLKVL